jgi:hypothetical protein
MAAFISDLVISIVPTFVVSRVLLLAGRRWYSSALRLLVVHALSLGLCIWAGFLVFEGHPSSRLTAALALFAPSQLAWLLVDAFRLVRQKRKAGE